MILETKKAEKCNTESGDGHEDGAICWIIGETVEIPKFDDKIYFVLWENFELPVAIANFRLKLHTTKKNITVTDDSKIYKYLEELKKTGILELYEKKE